MISSPVKASHAFGETLHVNVGIFMAIAEYFYLYMKIVYMTSSYMQVEQ